MVEGYFRFRVSSKLASLLGEQSVSDSTVALTELVKNSYDADASKIFVTFEKAKDEIRIIILDDGHGMTYEEIRDKWMVVGTSDKEFHRFSPSGRRKVGEKGIGRFSVQRLGNKFKMISIPKHGDEEIFLQIDWNNYEKPNITLDQIENPVKVKKLINQEHSKLQLIISELKDDWTLPDLERLKKQLSAIVPPFWNEKFSLTLHAPHFGIESETLGPALLEEAAYKLFCKMDEDGKVHYTIDLGEKKNHSSGKADFGKLSCGPLQFTLHYFPLGPSGEDKKLMPYVLKKAHLRRQLAENCGIRIYRDGFRVKPYGDTGDDWLGLNLIRLNQPALKFSNNTLIGILEIQRDKNPIIDTTTREGLVKNQPFHDMKTFLYQSIGILENQRSKDFKEEIPELYNSPSMKKIAHVANRLSKMATDPEDRNEIISSINELRSTAIRIQQEFINKTNMSYGLASLGISVGAVAHEIGDAIGAILQRAKLVLLTMNERPLSYSENKNFWTNTLSDILKIREFISFASVFTSAEERTKSAIDVKEIVRIVLAGYQSVLRDQLIKVETNFDDKMRLISGFKVDFESILINLITNSIEALRDIQTDRKIRITCKNETGWISIKFSDSGNGIPKDNRDFVFQPLWTSKKEGTGLGLPIMKEIVDGYKGIISITDSEIGKGATFLIRIPVGESP